MNEPSQRSDASDAAWASDRSGVKLRARSEREDTLLRYVAGAHAVTAALSGGAAYGMYTRYGTVEWPPWAAHATAIAALATLASAFAIWRMRRAPLAIPAVASLVAIGSLVAIAGYASVVLWLNVAVLGVLVVVLRARSEPKR